MEIKQQARFRKAFRRVLKRGKKGKKLFEVVNRIITKNLEIAHKDHALKGDFVGLRECHIEPDWLLVYQLDEKADILFLIDTGSHQDIFG